MFGPMSNGVPNRTCPDTHYPSLTTPGPDEPEKKSTMIGVYIWKQLCCHSILPTQSGRHAYCLPVVIIGGLQCRKGWGAREQGVLTWLQSVNPAS